MSTLNLAEIRKRPGFVIALGILAPLLLILLLAIFASTHRDVYYKAYHNLTGNSLGEMAAIHRDVKYCNTTNPSQEYDLFVPTHRPFGDVPIVIHVHGGGWRWGDKRNGVAKHYAQPLVDRGIAFATVSYRLADEATYPKQNEDVRCAVEHIQKNAKAYGINPSRVIMMGDSAGGHLAALEGLDASHDHVKAVIMLYGVSDLWEQITQYKDINAIHYLGEKNEQLANKASPYYQDVADAPPFLLVHGTADSIVPASESEKFAKLLTERHRSATFVSINGADHAFIGGSDKHEVMARPYILEFILINAMR